MYTYNVSICEPGKKGVQLKHEGNDRGMDTWGTSNKKGNSAWKSMRAEILFIRMEN